MPVSEGPVCQRITSRQNPLLRHLKKLLTSRAYREEQRQFAGEGTKLLEEAVRWEAGLRLVAAADGVPVGPLPPGARLVRVPADVLASLSQMQAPQGVLFACDLPEPRPLDLRPGALVVEGLQDPGNLGTILRTADALEAPVVLAEGCADPYNPKTVRAAMGALFRSPPQQAGRAAVAAQCRQRGIPLLAAALTPDAADIRQVPLDRAAVVVGSEGRGVSRELLDLADGTVVIPMNPRCESLNAAVAAAILLWQMRR